MDIISLKTAKVKNLPKYFTGKPCKRGHISLRYTKDRRCIACRTEYKSKFWKENKKRLSEDNRKYRNENKEKENKRTRDYYHNNIDKFTQYRKKNREKINEYLKQHYRKNKKKYVAKTAKRKATKLKATVLWANLEAIDNIYRNCPVGYHVDHIVPLQGKNVCGLHVENNLQYLKASLNKSKGNRFNE